MTLLPVDALVATLPRTDSARLDPAPAAAPRRTLTATLPARQPSLVPTFAGNTTGLAIPSAQGGVNLAAARRLKALQDIADATRRDLGDDTWAQVSSVFSAEIEQAQAQVESLKA